jgi:hypothetical protein
LVRGGVGALPRGIRFVARSREPLEEFLETVLDTSFDAAGEEQRLVMFSTSCWTCDAE